MTTRDAAAMNPNDLVKLIERVVDESAQARGDRERSALGTFWPIIVCLVTVTALAYVTYGRAAEAKEAIENPMTGLRSQMNVLNNKVDVGFQKIQTTLDERLPGAKPPR